MAKGQRHIDNNGNVGVCRAAVSSNCPYDKNGGHHDSREDAEAAYGNLQENGGIPESLSRPLDPKVDGFSLVKGGYYGNVPPRSIQIDAINATAEALIEDGNTQLVAACGTGKSYMGRQLMRRMMEEEDANGVAIVLTSSVKLAKDTAADLMSDSEGNYDGALGDYGKDYNVQVIEVHHEATGMKEAGAISVAKIAKEWENALADGKRVVVVSTYQSSDKVREVQALIGPTAEADLLMNDEAHNILGQKRSVSASEDADNSGYKSFANEIPGAIQAKHRLYATATPSLADSPDDSESSAQGATREEQIASMKAQVTKMAASGRERLTVYSDDELIVGRVSGAITQQAAISEGYLTEPSYQLRGARVSGVRSPDDLVNARGELATPRGFEKPLTAQTYSAVSATLQAMVEDPQTDEDGKLRNPVHNALVYAGSISQAEAFKDNFRQIAMEQSGSMDKGEAEAAKNSSDPELRRRARLRLLAEHGEVLAAHSGANKEAKAEKVKAFSMFRGKDYKAEDAESGWSPHKRVLANVDIFSEGISINEIDTVVIADQSKTSERAMTQAIGRSLRTIGGNEQKNTGHVIVPQVIGDNGKELNGGLVTAASYGATRVERALSTRKLKGETVAGDETTKFSRYGSQGELRDRELAANIARTHVKSSEDLLASQAVERAHQALGAIPQNADAGRRAQAKRYRDSTRAEQAEYQRSFISDQANSPKVKDATWSVAHKVLKDVDNADMATIRQSGRVVTSALSASDFSAVPPTMADNLSRSGIIRKRGGKSGGPSIDEQRAIALSGAPAVATSFVLPGGAADLPDVAAVVSDGVNVMSATRYANTNGKSGSADDYNRLVSNFETLVSSNDEAASKIFAALEKSTTDNSAASASLSGLLQQRRGINSDKKEALWSGLSSLKEQVAARNSQAAASGSAEYELDPSMVLKNGTLTAAAQRRIADQL